MRVAAACNSPWYQLRVSITTATAMPRCTVKEWITSSGTSSRAGGSSGMRVISATPMPRLMGVTWVTEIERSSGGSLGRAASARARVKLGTARELRLALLTAGGAQDHVMRAAGTGGFLLGVAGATVPDALSERRHGLSLPRFAAMGDELGPRSGASQVPLVCVKRDADFTSPAATPREVSCPFRS